MSTQRIISFGLWIGGAMLVLVALGFAERSNNSTICTSLEIRMDGDHQMQFINEGDIRRKVLDMGSDVIGAPLASLDLPKIETQLRRIPYLRDANVYHTMDGTLHVQVGQRIPIVRLLCADGSSYYISRQGWTMPLSDQHTARVFVVTGSVDENDPEYPVHHVLASDSVMDEVVTDEVYRLAQVISADPFWSAMIDQAIVDKNGEFTLIAKVGGQRLLVGDGTELSQRLAKLKEFYHKGIPMSGWRKYEKIDLRFGDQIVCTQKQKS